MDLDNFKARWQKDNEYQSQLKNKNMEQLQFILKEKTSSVMGNVKKKYEKAISVVLVGLLGTVILSPFLPWILGVDGPVFTVPTESEQLLSILVVALLGIVIIFFYWLKYTSVETTIQGDDLKLTLLENINQLKRSLRQEIYFFLFVYAALFIAARSTSQVLGYGDFWEIMRTDVLLALLAGVALVGYYLFQKVRQYRTHIKELQHYLAEFDKSASMD